MVLLGILLEDGNPGKAINGIGFWSKMFQNTENNQLTSYAGSSFQLTKNELHVTLVILRFSGRDGGSSEPVTSILHNGFLTPYLRRVIHSY